MPGGETPGTSRPSDFMETGGFVPIVVRKGGNEAAGTVASSRKWALQRSSALTLPNSAAVTDLSFSPLAPHDVAAASGPSVAIVDPHSGTVRRTLARFRDTARSPCFKPDGRLLVAGCDNGTVQLFDLASRSVLRMFNAHPSAVHSSLFTPDGLRVMTGCDDGIVRGWDIATSKLLFTLRGSADYVRTQASSPVSRHVWATGSYDRRARVYDLRTRKMLFTLDHGSQVDQVLLLPGGSRAVTLGGPDAKVWDFFAGGKLVGHLRNHAKAVTCGSLSTDGRHVLTGGLDGEVKVHDAGSLEMVSSMSFAGQVLSVAVAPQNVRVAVGLIDGTIDVRTQAGKRNPALTLPASNIGDEPVFLPQQKGALKERLFDGWGRGFEKQKRKDFNPGSMRYYLRGASAKPSDDRDVVVMRRKRSKLKKHDRLLQRFSYGEALDSVMVKNWHLVRTKLAVSVIEELIARDGLRLALSNRIPRTLEPVLHLLFCRIADPFFSNTLCHVLDIVLDLYAGMFGNCAENEGIDAQLWKIKEKVHDEVGTIRQLCSIQGMLDLLPCHEADMLPT